MNILKYAFNWLTSKLFDTKIKYEDDKKILKSSKCDCGDTLTIYCDHGLVDIEYDWHAGGPISGGINVSGHGHQEYQFHYNKCSNPACDKWEMIEYRETPSWWDDLWELDCQFTKGDIIKKFQNNEFYGKKYTSHKITRW